MRISRLTANNFCSYKDLEISFDTGLTKISGSTGSGKSTILDAVCWGLYGKTSKNAGADSIRPLDATKEEQTIVSIYVDDLVIVRKRGSSSADNDCHIVDAKGKVTRGKDNTETSKLIEQAIGISYDAFLSSVYLTQFSDSTKFFTMNTDARRKFVNSISQAKVLDEKEKKLKFKKESLNAEHTGLEAFLNKGSILISNYTSTLAKLTEDRDSYATSTKAEADALIEKSKQAEESSKEERKNIVDKITYLHKIVSELPLLEKKEEEIRKKVSQLNKLSGPREATKKELDNGLLILDQLIAKETKINELHDNCGDCGQPVTKEHIESELKKLNNDINQAAQNVQNQEKLLAEIDSQKALEPTFSKQLDQVRQAKTSALQAKTHMESLREQLDTVKGGERGQELYAKQANDVLNKKNPFDSSIKDIETKLMAEQMSQPYRRKQLDEINQSLQDVSNLKDVLEVAKNSLVSSSIKSIEQNTNKYLERFFDATWRIALEHTADSIEATIYVSGVETDFAMLSGGERRVLGFCFSFAASEQQLLASNQSCNVLFLDEVLGGLSGDGIREDAFRLLEDLSSQKDAIFVIEHADDFDVLFENQIKVVKTSSGSIATYENPSKVRET